MELNNGLLDLRSTIATKIATVWPVFLGSCYSSLAAGFKANSLAQAARPRSGFLARMSVLSPVRTRRHEQMDRNQIVSASPQGPIVHRRWSIK
jgi:hypothetical protein